jgi:methylenetetrahydrofolate--tRNA-(uracil-5-)-methyltransferase
LLAYITGDHIDTIDAGPRSYQPMNVNFGLFPAPASLPTKAADGTRLRGPAKAVAKKHAICARALADLEQWTGAARVAAE